MVVIWVIYINITNLLPFLILQKMMPILLGPIWPLLKMKQTNKKASFSLEALTSCKHSVQAIQSAACCPGKKASCVNICLSAKIKAQEFAGVAPTHHFKSALFSAFVASDISKSITCSFFVATVKIQTTSLSYFQLIIVGIIRESQLQIFWRKTIYYLLHFCVSIFHLDIPDLLTDLVQLSRG